MAQLKDTVITGDARVTGTLFAQDGTTTVPGLLSTADKTKLDGINAGAEVNQNAFSNVVVGSTTIAADSKTDTLTMTAGTNIALTPDATNDKVTIGLTGTVAVGNGGTGKTTGKDAANYFMNSLDTGSSTPVDADYYISQYVNGGTTTTTYHRRPMSALWSYISGKLNSVFGINSTKVSSWDTASANSHSHTNKSVLDGITSTKVSNWDAAEANQNAFSNVTVGSTTVAADSKTDTLTLVAGDNVTLTPDATNDKITIAATDTTYTPASANPLMDGTAAVGTSAKYAREDHRHPVDTSRAAASDLSNYVLKAGDTMTGKLVVPATRIANTYYGISFDRTTQTPKETILYTGIKWLSGKHMPVIHITGYAYGLSSPVEFKIGFYIYSNTIGWCGVTNMGSWKPNVYLFKYASDNVDYVAVGLEGQCYFLQLQVDVQDEMGKFTGIEVDSAYWSWSFLTTTGNIPTPDSGVTCIAVPYKADILDPYSNKTVLSGITSTNVSNWNTAYTNNHTHSNKSVLDGITSAKVSGWDAKQSALTEGTDYLNKTHLDNTYVAKTSVGANSGIAELDANGKVPSSQLPSFVDDVLEYSSQSAFPATGETGKIYIATDTNLTYRWSGSAYVVISSSLALGETSSTAYRGDRGKTAYDHSQNGDVHVTTTQKTNWNTAYTNNHTHSNKTVLDGISSTNVTNWGTAYTNSHTHSNKSLLDTYDQTNANISDAVNKKHSHSNSTVLNGITSTKVSNWDGAATNSHTHSNKSTLDGISGTDITNWNAKVPSTRTVNSKALSSDIVLTHNDITPIATKTYTGLIGSSDNHAGAGFYFGKVQPTGYNDVWSVRYQIEIWAPSETRCHAIAEVYIVGSLNTYRSYAAFNGITNTDYRPAYHHLIYCAKEAGITAGKGHALGVGLRASWNPTTAANPRTCTVKVLAQTNCTVTLNDTAVKWANWDGTGSTNYNTYYELNFSSNGLQETGDSAPEYAYYFSHSYSNILAKAVQYRYCLAVQYDENHMLPLNSVSNDTGTTKAMTTESFDPFGKIIYWGTTTTVSAEAAYGRYYQYQQYTDFNACYTFNCGSTLVANKAVYLVCAPQSDGKVKLHTTPWSQTLPTTEDNLLYIYLGQARTTTNMNLDYKHPIYYYHNGAIRQWTNGFSESYDDLTNRPTIPVAIADLQEDTTHRVVTDAQITSWNAKSDFSGSYNDLSNKPTIATSLAQLSDDSGHRTVTDAEKTAWNGKYVKSSTGIPIDDLSDEVQTLLRASSSETAVFTDEIVIGDVRFKRYTTKRLMITDVES